MKRPLLILIGLGTHSLILAIGFVLGIYFLPIIMARNSPDSATLQALSTDAKYTAAIQENLRGNDFLHHGSGTISLTETQIVHEGEIAPGPDYVLYLVPQFVEHEDEFIPLKDQSKRIGRVDAFRGFAIDIPNDVKIDEYTTVLVWCEAFSEFIFAAQYR